MNKAVQIRADCHARVPRKWRTIVIGALLALAVGLGVWFGRSKLVPRSNQGLEVDKVQLDFGEAWCSSEFPWTLSVSNPSTVPIHVVRWHKSCKCISIEPEELTIPARKKVDVQLVVDLRAPDAELAAEARRPFDFVVTPVVRGAHPQQSGWRVRGTVRNAFSVGPIEFRDVVPGSPQATRRVPITCHVPLATLACECRVPGASASIEPGSDEGADFVLQITLSDELAPGRLSFPVILRGVLSDGGAELPPVEVAVHGRVVDDLQLVPPALAFGLLAEGESTNESVVVRSRGGEPFEIESIESNLPEITGAFQEPAADDAGQVCLLRLAGAQAGARAGEIQIRVRYQGGICRVASLPITYQGLANTPPSTPDSTGATP